MAPCSPKIQIILAISLLLNTPKEGFTRFQSEVKTRNKSLVWPYGMLYALLCKSVTGLPLEIGENLLIVHELFLTKIPKSIVFPSKLLNNQRLYKFTFTSKVFCFLLMFQPNYLITKRKIACT